MSAVFAWHERGAAFEVLEHPGSLVEVALRDGRGWRSTVELPVVAVHELREALGEMFGDPTRAELLESLHASDAAANEADAAVHQLTEQRDELRETADKLRREVEQLKSAGEIADRQIRALERDIERMRTSLVDEILEGRS